MFSHTFSHVAAMLEPLPGFRETHLNRVAIRDLGLAIEGTRLQPIIGAFTQELERVGLTNLQPRFYLSTEWGVSFGTIAIAIPFYLARPELAALHAERTGMVEGFDVHDLMRYLRHEMGHVVNYAYKLYERREWVQAFGAITQPYVEDYRPQPFSRRFVRHLPGWYAQKHPDEDWAETFAVWMTPDYDWRTEYADRPTALAKLSLCDAIVREVAEKPPVVTTEELDDDVNTLHLSLDEFYRGAEAAQGELPPGLDGALRATFRGAGDKPAAGLIGKLESSVCTEIYRWTGHFPERTRPLVRHLGRRAEALGLTYAASEEPRMVVALTALITALAMNYVHHGSYLP
jgi:hypothetical protein